MNAPLNMVNFAAAVCGFAPANQNDLDGLVDHEYVMPCGLVLRCYLEHAEAITNGGDAHPDAKERVWLVYAFAGTVDVFELVEQAPGLQDKIEAAALKAIKEGEPA